MNASHVEPDYWVGVAGIAAIIGFAMYRLLLWVRNAPVSPDPWSPEISKSLDEPDAVPACTKCATPQPPGQWFCDHCGAAVGDYNNLMPYVRVFSEGEVLRTGVGERFRVNMLTLVGYVILPLVTCPVFAPFYWYFLFKNLKRMEADNSNYDSTQAEPN